MYSSSQTYWDLVSYEELPSMMRCMSDMLSSVLKSECLREEMGVEDHQQWYESPCDYMNRLRQQV